MKYNGVRKATEKRGGGGATCKLRAVRLLAENMSNGHYESGAELTQKSSSS
jgi:hypothetical protein